MEALRAEGCLHYRYSNSKLILLCADNRAGYCFPEVHMSENTAGVDNCSEHVLLNLFLKHAWDLSFLKIMTLILLFSNSKAKIPLARNEEGSSS